MALAAAIALAAERAAADPAGRRDAASSQGAPADIEGFLAPIRREFTAPHIAVRVERDPLSAGRTQASVARAGGTSTVTSSGRSGRRLTAILIADDRPVAVLDEAVVGIGDRLPDGARVDAIRSDRVWVVEPNGRRQMLTLTPGRP